MIESLHEHDRTKILGLMKDIEDIVADPGKSSKMSGYDDVFIARSRGYRVIYRRTGDSIQVTSVLRDARDVPQHLS
jgi:plasmid stabilization system protein ParE